ncbi:hypothetical protein JTE90_024634 [Oedothorax gibbosus]|uniref:CCR4-NOT transcription complex subunit 10 n=1 Tax=Oedothorax gibbosus TaxID=931172 RepID=A0AAV6U3C8_9ARAC|nr:hypothetical protein JTE90_024634 [Oedothorax gibbosus]
MCDDKNDARKSSCDGFNYQSVPDADREMSAQALQEFENQKYGQSLSSMKKLLSKRPLDSKVFHNTSVVEFYLSNCKKTEQFNRNMVEICKQAHIDVNDLETLDDVDNCVVLYNQAVVQFHLHQYYAAISILDKVFQYIEPLEETLARNICFLLLECYLSISKLDKASYLIGYLEGMMFGGSKSCTSTNQKDKDNSKDDSNDIVTEAIKRKLQLCKARCYAMRKTSKACKREIKNLMSSGSNVQNIPAFYLKSQLEYQRGNYRKALKLLNSVTLPEDISKYFKETGDCLPAIFYNNVGCIHFYMGKPNLGAFYMEQALQAFESEIKAITSKASTTSDNKLNCRSLHQMSLSTRHQLMYNLGMQFFQAKKFNKAFDCFVEAVKSFHSNPRLWLRIAECCIQLYKPDCLEEYLEYKGKPFVKSIIGSGTYRKVIMNSASEKLPNDESKSSTKETPSMQFAMLCLKNALFLVGEYSYREGRSEVNNPPEDEPEPEYKTIAVLPSNSIQDCDVMYLRNSIIVACAYVALCLGDVLLVLQYTDMIQLQPMMSAAHKFFAHMYAGEAMLIMDKITNAVDNFNLDSYDFNCPLELTIPVANTTENSLKHQSRFDLKYIENLDGSRLVGNLPKWYPDSIATGYFISHYNLAVAYAMREEWSKALESLLRMSPDENVPSYALSLLMYIHCHQGSVDNIESYIKKYIQPVKQ